MGQILGSPYVAHAFGQDFGLPLPLWLFVYGAVSAVLLSFVAMGLMYDSRTSRPLEPRPVMRVPSWLVSAARTSGGLVLLLMLAVAFFGPQDAADNMAATYFWVLLLVGGVYGALIGGNAWRWLNPFAVLALPGEKGSGRYPSWLGYWPAVVGFAVFSCMELIFRQFATIPMVTGILMIGIIVSIRIGVQAYGADWLRYSDFFSVYFRLISLLSPVSYSGGRIALRKPSNGLLTVDTELPGLAVFCVLMLAVTSFDGLTETVQFAWVADRLPGVVAGLVVFAAVFSVLYGLYMLGCQLMRRISGSGASLWRVSAAFAPSLLPIAVGYNIAHYLSFFVQTGQTVITQASDPFGLGWNLAGSAGSAPLTGPMNPYVAWYIQIGAIIVGHVAAVYIAHRIAVRLFGDRRASVLSQLPMVGIMVVYTMVSLWIIAQPAYIAQAKSDEADKRQRQFQEVLRPPAAPMPPMSP